MALSLSSQDLNRLQAAQQTLLSPLEFSNTSAWELAVLHAIERLFRADRSMHVLARGDGAHFCSETLEPSMLTAFRERAGALQSGSLRFKDPELEQALGSRRTAGLEVWNNAVLERMSGLPMQETELYHEVILPAGVAHGAAMGTSVAGGEAMLAIAHSRPQDDPFGYVDGLSLLSLLLPAFKAGVHALESLQARRVSLAATLDGIADALLVVGLGGRELHRSRQLSRLLEEDPEGGEVLGRMQGIARRLSLERLPATKSTRLLPAAVGEMQVRTARYTYDVRGGYVAPGAFARDAAVLISLERRRPVLPTAESLGQHHGLTRREAEVARLLALGLSNKQAAGRLFLSPHTVRTHAQHVFQKLGVHTRKALALRLLDRPEGAPRPNRAAAWAGKAE